MQQITALAKSIEQELNDNLNANAFGLKFKIHANAGNYKKAVLKADGTRQKFINGVLRGSTGNYVPVKGLNNLFATLMLEFAVPQDKCEQMEMVLNSWTESVLGEVFSLDGWNLLITPQPATPGLAKDTSPIGATVPFLVALNVQLIKDGLISNVVKWTVNGQAIQFENVSGTWNRTPDIKPKANKGTCVADNQYENQTLVVIMAYTYSAIVQKIANDIINHNIDAVYNITRDDGFADKMEQDFILTNAEINEQSGKIVSFTLTFNPA